jgi:hypothetical protein
MGLVGTINAFSLLCGPLLVLAAAGRVSVSSHPLLLIVGLVLRLVQWVAVATLTSKSVPFSDAFARCVAAAAVPALFFAALSSGRWRKTLSLAGPAEDRAKALAVAVAAGLLFVDYVGPFLGAVAQPGFNREGLVAGVTFNLRLISMLGIATAAVGRCPAPLAVAVAAAGGLHPSLECEAGAAAAAAALGLWFSRKAHRQQ